MKALLEDSRHRAGLMAAALLLGGLLLGHRVLVEPAQRALRQLRQTLAAERVKGEALRRVVALEQAIDGYRAVLWQKRDAKPIIELVNRLGGEAQLSLSSVTELTPVDEGKYVRLPVQIETYCTFHQLGHFISRIEESRRFLKLEQVRMDDRRDPNKVAAGYAVSITVSGLVPVR